MGRVRVGAVLVLVGACGRTFVDELDESTGAGTLVRLVQRHA